MRGVSYAMQRAVRRGPVLTFLTMAALLGSARADDLTAIGAQPLFETAHTVEVSIKSGVANYRVHRVFENRGTGDDEVELIIELPAGASTTGLRVRAHGGAWITGEWADAKTAKRSFYRGSGRGDASTPSALLRWLGSNFIDLQAFPIPAGSSCEVQYDLAAPTTYEHGHIVVTYPRRSDSSSTVMVDPVLSVTPSWTGAAIVVDGATVLPGAATALVKSHEQKSPAASTISISAPTSDIMTTRLGRVVASQKHSFARLEVDVSPQLSSLPKNANIVFVVDASYSMTEAGMAAELGMVRSYLRNVPDARFEIVAFRRRAERIFDRFVAAADAQTAIAEQVAKHRFALGNGSSLDDGARLAIDALIGHGNSPRIVFITDERMRKAFTTAPVLAMLAKAPVDTVVHVVTPSVSERDTAQLFRDDDSNALAPLAKQHHGITASWLGASSADSPDSAAVALQLVRPTQLDNVEVTGLHIPLIYGGLLHEGDSIRATRALAKAPTQVTIDAMLWSQPVHRVLTVNSEFSRIFAGWVFSEDEATELSQNEKLTVATMAHTVTPVTSFVVTRAGSREEPLSTSGVGSGGSNYSAVDTIGSSNTPHGHLHPDLAALLDHEVKACVAANHPAVGWTRDLTVETTRDEVVDVRSKDTDAMSQCLVEAVWGVRLTAAYTLERDEYALSLH